jgi:hypothetical protein
MAASLNYRYRTCTPTTAKKKATKAGNFWKGGCFSLRFFLLFYILTSGRLVFYFFQVFFFFFFFFQGIADRLCGMAVFTFDASGWWVFFPFAFMGWHLCCLRLFILSYFLKPYPFLFLFCFSLCSCFWFSPLLDTFLLASLYLCCTYLGRAEMIPGGYSVFFVIIFCSLI